MGLRAIQGGEVPDLGLADYLCPMVNDDKFSFEHRLITFQAFTPPEEGEVFVPVLPYVEGGDFIFSPAHHLLNPSREQPSLVVLTEPRNTDDVALGSRARLRMLRDKGAWRIDDELRWAFRQQFSTDGNTYELLSAFMQWCLEAGICIHSGSTSDTGDPFGFGFGEFQVGSRGFDAVYDAPEITPSLLACDHFWIARWALLREAARLKMSVMWTYMTVLVTVPEKDLRGAFPDTDPEVPRTSLLPPNIPFTWVVVPDLIDPCEAVIQYLYYATGIDPQK
jgi:hypothetical protein